MIIIKVKTIKFILINIILYSFFSFSLHAYAKDKAHDYQIESQIINMLSNKIEVLKANNPNARLSFFVDWDGTMMNGDITEGLHDQVPQAERFMGLAELAFKYGLVQVPLDAPSEYKDYVAEYEKLLLIDHGIAYAWSANYFANLPPQKELLLRELINNYFKAKLKSEVFKTSSNIVNFLKAQGIEIFVISASPTVFVEGTLNVFPWLTIDHVYGINRAKNVNGNLIDPIINYAMGKVERINSILSQDEDRVILGGMGNSWNTDGAFLQLIAQKGGVSVMFNGGKPNSYNYSGIYKYNISETLGSEFNSNRVACKKILE